MELKKRSEPFSVTEICLPLFFFSNEKIFYAAIAIALTAGLTFFILELLRRPFAKNDLAALYLFWLVTAGSAAWFFLNLPPYWVLSVYLCVPVAAWSLSKAARGKPFLSGLQRNGGKQARMIVQMLFFMLLFAAILFGLSYFIKKTFVWMVGVSLLIAFEILISKFKRQKV